MRLICTYCHIIYPYYVLSKTIHVKYILNLSLYQGTILDMHIAVNNMLCINNVFLDLRNISSPLIFRRAYTLEIVKYIYTMYSIRFNLGDLN